MKNKKKRKNFEKNIIDPLNEIIKKIEGGNIDEVVAFINKHIEVVMRPVKVTAGKNFKDHFINH